MDERLTALFAAARADDRATVEHMLDEDASLIEARGDGGESLLLAAVYASSWHVAERLLSRGARHDVFTAAATGDTALLPTFCEGPAALVDAFSDDGWTPLHLAAFFGHPDAARLLIERGAGVRARSRNGTANEPLHAAAVRGHDDVVKLLLASGADPNAVAGEGYTALMLAAGGGHRAVVERLLAAGADPSVRNDGGFTAAALAAQRGHAGLAGSLTAHEGRS